MILLYDRIYITLDVAVYNLLLLKQNIFRSHLQPSSATAVECNLHFKHEVLSLVVNILSENILNF